VSYDRRYSTAKAAVNEAQAGIPAAQAGSSKQRQIYKSTSRLHALQQSILKQGAIPRQQLDTTRAAYQVVAPSTEEVQPNRNYNNALN